MLAAASRRAAAAAARPTAAAAPLRLLSSAAAAAVAPKAASSSASTSASAATTSASPSSSSSSSSSSAVPENSVPSSPRGGGGGGGGASGGRRSTTVGVPAAIALAGASMAGGYAAGRSSSAAGGDGSPSRGPTPVLPGGLPRSCCSCESPPPPVELTSAQRDLPARLAEIVGPSNVLSASEENSSTSPYLRGARLGGGTALAIARPHSLGEAVECLRAVVDAECAVIPQGANTGLTGGSVPRSDDRDPSRPRVVISMRSLDAAFPIDGGRRVVCLAGVGISDLSDRVSSWFPGRESHSVLGSVFLNPTAAAGVALGSGGTQLRKGPAYTDRAMYARVDRNKWGENVITVVNTLGIEGIEDSDFAKGGGSAVEQLDAYAGDVRGGYTRAMGRSSGSSHGRAVASDADYARRVCSDGGGVSRCNADTRGEDCNRSEGKVLILATVHDTFPRPESTRTFWVSFRDLDTALAFRREVCLSGPEDLPISVEYMDRDCFDVIDESGRISANLIKVIGTGSMMARLWNVKLRVEALPFDWAPLICDKMLHRLNGIMPAILPSRIMKAGRAMDHHVAMTVGEYGGGTMDRVLERMHRFAEDRGADNVVIHECRTKREERSLSAFRFVAAPAFRTWCVGNGVQGVSVDYALPKNGGEAPPLAEGGAQTADGAGVAAAATPLRRMRYSHFGCNVVHEDLAYGPDVDVHAAKMALKGSVERGSGGRLPAEHGHGTEYGAPPETRERWRRMDPLNVMNPGIGGMSAKFRYRQ